MWPLPGSLLLQRRVVFLNPEVDIFVKTHLSVLYLGTEFLAEGVVPLVSKYQDFLHTIVDGLFKLGADGGYRCLHPLLHGVYGCVHHGFRLFVTDLHLFLVACSFVFSLLASS
jgi:hypothetical protein